MDITLTHMKPEIIHQLFKSFNPRQRKYLTIRALEIAGYSVPVNFEI